MKIEMIEKNFPIWEIEGFDLPEIYVDSGEVYYQADDIPPLRNQVNIISENQDEFYKAWEKNTKLIEEKIKSEDDIILREMWIDKLKTFKWPDHGTVRILADNAGYKMQYHFDNRLIFGVLIINLIDNVNSTRFRNGYEGPVKKGTGIFIMNNGDEHMIEVTKDRLIGYQTLAVADCIT